VSWGPIGRVIFLIVAAAFLTDTWLRDGRRREPDAGRHRADPLPAEPAESSCGSGTSIFLGLLTVVTCFTMLLDAPGPLILISAVIGFAGTVIFPVALYLLNHRVLAAAVPEWARPAGGAAAAGPLLRGLSGAGGAYLLGHRARRMTYGEIWSLGSPRLDAGRGRDV